MPEAQTTAPFALWVENVDPGRVVLKVFALLMIIQMIMKQLRMILCFMSSCEPDSVVMKMRMRLELRIMF